MNLGMSEIILILIVALVVIGPKRLPDVAKSIGKGYGEFKRVFNDMKKSVDLNVNINDDEPVRKRSSESTYKSRWEEQNAPAAQITGAEATQPPAPSVDNTQKPETTQTPRAKRGDLIKEKEDGNGQD